MKTVQMLYDESIEILKKTYLKQKTGYVEAVKNIAFADTNYKSVKAMISRKLDTGGLSKTALKDVVAGHVEVIDAEDKLNKWKSQKEIKMAEMKYIEHEINLNKKLMDSIISEIKYMGN